MTNRFVPGPHIPNEVLCTASLYAMCFAPLFDRGGGLRQRGFVLGGGITPPRYNPAQDVANRNMCERSFVSNMAIMFVGSSLFATARSAPKRGLLVPLEQNINIHGFRQAINF